MIRLRKLGITLEDIRRLADQSGPDSVVELYIPLSA
ncbi:hypothetical protein ACRZ5O_28320 [Pseudomonas protegens]